MMNRLFRSYLIKDLRIAYRTICIRDMGKCLSTNRKSEIFTTTPTRDIHFDEDIKELEIDFTDECVGDVEEPMKNIHTDQAPVTGTSVNTNFRVISVGAHGRSSSTDARMSTHPYSQVCAYENGRGVAPSSSYTGAFTGSSRWPDPNNIPVVPFQGEIIKVLVYDVYDGDTCSILFRVGEDGYMKLRIRVNGVDTPEVKVLGKMKGTELGKLEEKAGAHVRDEVKALIEGKECNVKLNKWDKYGGRVNGVIFLSGSKYTTLTEYLLAKRYAKEYHGQAKEEWKLEELQHILST